MSTYSQTKYLSNLLIILLVILAIFLYIDYRLEQAREDLVRKKYHIVDKSELCLSGRQSDRARVCPDLIRNGHQLSRILNSNCSNNKDFIVVYLNDIYDCDMHDKLMSKINNFIRALK